MIKYKLMLKDSENIDFNKRYFYRGFYWVCNEEGTIAYSSLDGEEFKKCDLDVSGNTYYNRFKTSKSFKEVKRVNILVHILVYAVHRPEEFRKYKLLTEEKYEIHHKDGNSRNNKISNLEIKTREEHVETHNNLRRLKNVTEQS